MYHLFDEPLGAHIDKYFLRESGINETLEYILATHAISADMYTDKGLSPSSHVIPAYHGWNITAQQDLCNCRMSKLRCSHEWGHAKMYERNPFLKQVGKLKLQSVDVAQYVRAAMILTNIHTCLHQSNMGLSFQCRAPSLEKWARPQIEDAL